MMMAEALQECLSRVPKIETLDREQSSHLGKSVSSLKLNHSRNYRGALPMPKLNCSLALELV